MAKSAPARHLATKCSVSDSMLGERGCLYGNAATPTQKSPASLTSRTRSQAYSTPSGCRIHSPCGLPGGSPRTASTLRMPAPANRPTMCRSSATEWLTAVRWAIGSRVVSVATRSVTATVLSRVEPPAPYVIDTNDGRSGSSSRIACQSWRSMSASFGGKNSKENVGSPARMSRPMDSGRPGITEGRPSATL